ncbi:phage tail protein [Dankookia sp. P2]|uniref:phage tail protein n=1 Tax=Dankookia sp. P2 TaxID=3423955 RepID=UPI003D67F82D
MTLRYGLTATGSNALWQWLMDAASGNLARVRRTVSIIVLDAANVQEVLRWNLRQGLPVRVVQPGLRRDGAACRDRVPEAVLRRHRTPAGWPGRVMPNRTPLALLVPQALRRGLASWLRAVSERFAGADPLAGRMAGCGPGSPMRRARGSDSSPATRPRESRCMSSSRRPPTSRRQRSHPTGRCPGGVRAAARSCRRGPVPRCPARCQPLPA